MLDRKFVEGSLETALAAAGMSMVVWSPLAQGILTGKYNNGIPQESRYEHVSWFKEHVTEEKLVKARGIEKLARELGTTSAALAIAWTLKNPLVASAITGATKPAQVTENLKALDVKITDEINDQIEKILDNKPMVEKYN
jgi:aryl-alcohol dehydrogenase-like predicted oxidoreductase